MEKPESNKPAHSQPPRTREELWERIREVGREAMLHEEMVRFGFWPADQPVPDLPPEQKEQMEKLQAELSSLYQQRIKLENTALLLKEIRRKRMEESKRKQAETKKKREEARRVRAEAWKQRKQTQITWLGEGVSGGLNLSVVSFEPAAHPSEHKVYASAEELATAMGISVPQLRFLAYHRTVSRISHYRRFTIPKKTGGVRLISAPMPRLKAVQHWILDHLLRQYYIHTRAHGFVPQRSIVTNAREHLNADVVMNLDLKDFFPSVAYPRVKGLFMRIGHSESVSTILALLCTEADVEEVMLDGEKWYVHTGHRRLPQGAPTSPCITNLICFRLDKRLLGLAGKHGFRYTRYADDITFSAENGHKKSLNKLRFLAKKIIAEEGFEVHPDKERMMRKGSRKEVTGLVVTDKVSVARDDLRRFRALLHQIEKTGTLKGKSWGNGADISASMHGFACFVHMVDPGKGALLRQQVKLIIQKYDPGFYRRYRKRKAVPSSGPGLNQPPPFIPSPPNTSTPEGEKKKNWWQFWKK